MIRTAIRLVPAMLRGRSHLGNCPTCDRRTLFVEQGPWLRDQLVCLRCGSIPRWRALSVVLDEQFPRWPSLRIHEAAPGGAASTRLKARCAHYSYSYFGVPDEPSEDLEALTLDDETIDLFITQDVFEHVLRPDVAFAEIARVLRPGGAHVFTVPMYERPTTLVRVGPDGDYLVDPDFHAGPEGPSLVVREWGRDLPGIVDEAGRFATSVFAPRSRHHGIDGAFIDVLVSRRL